MDAIKKYDPSKKVRIQSYMQFRIRGAILDGLRALDWSPRELRRKARLIEQAELNLRSRLGRSPAEAEIAAEMGISQARLQRLAGELRGLDLCSLQDIVSTSEDGVAQELNERLAGPPEEGPFHLCAQAEKKEQLARAVEQLPEKERRVLALYYFEELTMKEIGRVLSVGESRVSQIHSLALVRLRSLLARPASVRPRATEAFAVLPEKRASRPHASRPKAQDPLLSVAD